MLIFLALLFNVLDQGFNLILLPISAIVQPYETDVGVEYVLLGNDVIFKCKIPSFVDDFVTIINWIDNEGDSIYPKINKGKNTVHLLNGQKNESEQKLTLFVSTV